jgi:hypothetical protein
METSGTAGRTPSTQPSTGTAWPAAKAWFGHIAESHLLQHVEVAHKELSELVRRSNRSDP